MDPLAELIGESAELQVVREVVGRLLRRSPDARRLPPVLIQGETGTGKGLLARAIHRVGPRAAGPFVDLNCAAIPETLLEAELFGFERGAFTDARHAKAGLFQTANHGMLFLDEIALLPDALQSKLLTALEERAVRRLGSTKSEAVDVWILSASNAELAALVRERRFREELFHRLAVVTVSLPPLRARGRDVLLLARHFLARSCADYALPPKTLAPDALAALEAYPWPGNVRELANVMERVALLTEATVVTAAMLGLAASPGATPRDRPREAPAGPDTDAVARLEREREQLLEALRETDWNVSRAAARLGLPRNTIRYRIEKHGLRRGAPAPPTPRPASPAVEAPRATPEPPAPVAGPRPGPASLRWALRRLTVLRATLVADPAAAELSGEATRALEAFVEKVQNFGGRVEEVGRTSLVAAFGLEPVEDAARRAAHAAMAIQKISERARRETPERPPVAVGIYTRQFPVAETGGLTQIDLDAKREAWAVLEAILAGARPEAVLVSRATATFLERRFELEPVGSLSGVPGECYRIAGLGRDSLGPRLGPFVGRDDALELLWSRLASARRGHGQVIGIGGEPGMGKSRLLLEFRQRLASEPVTYLEASCVSYGTATPYLPLIEILRQGSGITEADSPQAVATRLRVNLRRLGMDPDEGAPCLVHLLGLTEGTERLESLSPEAIHARTFDLLRQMCLRESRLRPLVLAVENLHWIDRASESFLASLMDSLAGASILLLLTSRPGYRPDWMERSYATQMALPPLAPEDSATVVRSALPAAPEPLVQRIVDTAEGNPFFLEELARSVGERGDTPSTLQVPDTVEEVLLARIERLPDEPKRLLDAAAVLGRAAPRRLLAAIWVGEGSLDVPLRELMRLEFLFEKPAADDSVYVFRHALTYEVAYAHVPAARRQALHLAAGDALERLYADRLDEIDDRLAYHFAHTEETEKAVRYLTRQADKAARRYAHLEAVTALRAARAHVAGPGEAEDARRIELVLREAHSLSFLGRFAETRDLLLGERDRLEGLGSPALAGPYHFWLSHTASYLGDHVEAEESATRALEAARRIGDEATMGKAYVVLAQEGYWAGHPLLGIVRGARAVDLLDRAGESWWLGLAHWIVGINNIILGAFDAALEAEARAQAVGEALGDPRIQSYATWSRGWIHALTGAFEAGIEACREALSRSTDPVNHAVTLGHLGYVYLEKQEAGEALPLLAEAVAAVGEFGFRRLLGRFTTFLGEAYLLDGQIDRAHDLVHQGAEITREVGYAYGYGWAQEALGRIAHTRGDLEEAESCFRGALETFVRTHARFMVARTRLDLAELARARGDRDAAVSHLREAHSLFATLRVQRDAARVQRLAQELDMSLADEPVPPYLAVVRRGETEIFEALQAQTLDLHLRQVIWDRRSGEDRGAVPAPSPTAERRASAPGTWDALGFLLAPSF
jgi:DNA-binding NtrC family response regulator/tetratricopeptide (TPR) repeat protein